MASSTNTAGAASPDIAGVASPAIAGVASSVVGVEVASSTDPVGDGDFSGTYGVTCEKDWLAPGGSLGKT